MVAGCVSATGSAIYTGVSNVPGVSMGIATVGDDITGVKRWIYIVKITDSDIAAT